ncbi:GNAT family N-acetyltransferase [Vibrio ruber]|uniref:GNAT family N-acetyltransferase n=1 Tax=Vibrio ruber TaxID=184755 RepID=UPI003520E24C
MGQGIATQAINLLPAYVAQYYPDFEVLQLTVNCRNKAAYHCYSKCGFEDTGELYLSGPAGPQHIMQRKVAV